MPEHLTREQRSLLSQVANSRRWAKLTSAERSAATQAARDARFAKYLEQVPADPAIADPAEQYADRLRRARQLRDADLAAARLAATTRRRAAQARQDGAA
jgi:hypothetical protein